MPRSKGPLGSRHVRRLTIGPGRGEGRAPPWSLVVSDTPWRTPRPNTPEELIETFECDCSIDLWLESRAAVKLTFGCCSYYS